MTLTAWGLVAGMGGVVLLGLAPKALLITSSGGRQSHHVWRQRLGWALLFVGFALQLADALRKP